ncbi:MAG TPA: DUF4158 domain-containing protein, partial [Nakamurella multipartita]|nr:DUF4158 domain-containing protein [Nakamurella multipartita]
MSDEGVAGYGRFGSLSRVELERFFHLDDEDRRLIGARRRDYNRLGFALQVVTVRNLGMFLADPLDVPPELVDYLAEQLGIEDPSGLPEYLERRPTRFDHQAEIQQAYGLRAFSEVEEELAAWIADQAWMTGDGPNAILTGAVAWLREHQTLLPGITTLEKIVASGREAADRRLWTQLAGQLSTGRAGRLLALLEVPDQSRQRISELDRLRKGVFRSSSKGMVAALRRVAELTEFGAATVDVSSVPPRRLLTLAQ